MHSNRPQDWESVRDLMSLMGLFCSEPSQRVREIKVGRQQYTFFKALANWASAVIYYDRL